MRNYFTVDVSIDLDGQFIDDVLTTCFEGGSNYWVSEVKFRKYPQDSYKFASEIISRGGTLTIVDGEENEEHQLDLRKFINGVKRYIHYCIDRKQPVILDPSMIDGDIADNILQFALFDSIIYG